MKISEFFRKYANTPLKNRFIILNFNSLNMTLNQIYKRLKELGNQIRPLRIEEEELLREAEEGFANLKKKEEEK